MNFPELPVYPRDAGEILSPKDGDGRPVVWDEDGIPLNSDVPGPGFRPTRDAQDYELAPYLVSWPSAVGPKWTNTGLMHHVQTALPDMLATTVESVQGIREILGTNELFNCEEALIAIEGLHKSWSLLMYGPHRLNNGELPTHFAGLQRILAGHEGALLGMLFDSPIALALGIQNNIEVDPDKFVDFVFEKDGQHLKNSKTNESCPASRAAHTAIVDCLFMPPDEAILKHGEQWLSKANSNKSLRAYGLAPDMLGMLGAELSNVMRNPTSVTRRENLRMSHRYLVGDRSEEVETYMMQSMFAE